MSTKIWKYLFLKLLRGSEIDIIYILRQCWSETIEKNAKSCVVLEPQAIENSFKRAYGEVEDNIIIYIERLKTYDLGF